MFKRMLVALDGSENAERVLPWVELYARRSGGQVILIRVIDVAVVPTFSAGPGISDVLYARARKHLETIQDRLNLLSIPTRSVITAGGAAGTIVEAADAEECDAIAMTTRGGSPVLRWMMGGVTEQVMRLSHVPVLVTRSQTSLPQQARVKKILVPLDGSALSESILPWSESLARFHGAEIAFVHVMPKRDEWASPAYDKILDALTERMADHCAKLRERGVEAVFQTQSGDPALEILKRANRGANLIAMTTHGFGGFKRWLFGSVAEKVIHEARVPVLVYRAPSPAREALKELEAHEAGRKTT